MGSPPKVGSTTFLHTTLLAVEELIPVSPRDDSSRNEVRNCKSAMRNQMVQLSTPWWRLSNNLGNAFPLSRELSVCQINTSAVAATPHGFRSIVQPLILPWSLGHSCSPSESAIQLKESCSGNAPRPGIKANHSVGRGMFRILPYQRHTPLWDKHLCFHW